MGVFFEARVSGFQVKRPLHDLHFKWTFDDPGEWTALSLDNPHGRDRNLAYGPWCVHSFEMPGNYKVRLVVSDGIHTALSMIAIAVQDPDKVYALRTHVVSQSGDFSGAPQLSVRHQSLKAALDALPRNGRVLLRAGDVFDAKDFSHSRRGQLESLYLGRFGIGGDPVVETLQTGLFFRNAPNDVTITNLRFAGGYDARTGLGTAKNALRFIDLHGHITIHDCHFSGINIALYPSNRGDPAKSPKLIVSNCTITNWKALALLSSILDQSGIVGCSMKQKRTASTGPGGKTDKPPPNWPTHGPVRLGGSGGTFTIHHSEFFNNAGWSGLGKVPGGAHQQCIRWNSNGAEGLKGCVERCVLEGGYNVFIAAAHAGPRISRPVELIFERNYVLATANTVSVIRLGYGGTTIRNNIVVRPDVPAEYVEPRAFISWHTPNSTDDNNRTPVQIINNSFVDLRHERTGKEHLSVETGQSPFENLQIANNIIHGPYLPKPITPYAPLADSPPIFAPEYDGKRYDGSYDPIYATPPDTTASFRPLPGSSALNAANNITAIDDFDGKVRTPDRPSIGPFHFAANN